MIRGFLDKNYSKVKNMAVYFYVKDIEKCQQMYQQLIDENILYFNHGDPHSDIKIIPKTKIVRLTSNRERYKNYSLKIRKLCFNPTYTYNEHEYENTIFAIDNDKYIVINFDVLLRKEKIKELKNIALLE